MDDETLHYDLNDDGVAEITLNRPEVLNALNLAMGRELLAALRRADDDPAVRAVVLTGSGKAFCAGGDLRSFAAEDAAIAAHIKDVTTALHDAVSCMARMDAPIVVAVNGVAAGGGMALAIAGDLLLAAESARFTMAYTRAGLTPDGSSTYYLPRLVGLRRALDLTLTNRTITAAEALDWGLASAVLPDAELLPRARELAATLAAGATHALGEAKRLLRAGWNETLETQMALESRTVAAASASAEAREGISAFIEKRPPRFPQG